MIALTLVPGIGPITAKKILAQTGSAKAFFKEASGLKLPGIKSTLLSKKMIDEYLKRSESECRYILKEGLHLMTYRDRHFPNRLKACEDGPVVIYCKGEIKLNVKRMIAIVGTRNASEYGKNMTASIVEELAPHHCTIVSGLAYGIDTIAHRTANNSGIQNIGVLAHGMDRIYPWINRGLALKMIENGGLVSEFLSGTNPDRENFPKRNRIIAGLADAIVVVEAAKSGGALITADLANSYHRDVFAVPGRLGDEYSVGCNELIRRNMAEIISSPADIPCRLGWLDSSRKKKNVQSQLFVELNEEEERIIVLLRQAPKKDIDNLALESGLGMSKTSSILLSLEFKGVVQSLPGKFYKVI